MHTASRLGRIILAGLAASAFSLAATVLRAQSVATAPTAISPSPAPDDSLRDFAKLVGNLSEVGGYFDTDNLISNERSYLHVMGALDRLKVRGGAYIGVGPDQNFSYIARIRPRIAFMVDIRRDNLLQHLLFKALFAHSRNRAEYLALWTGRPMPDDVARFTDKPIEQIVAWVDSARTTAASTRDAIRLVQREVQATGIPLSATDLATIARFHTAFMSAGLSLRFTSTGRAPREYYPTLRQLILERDLNGQLASYLARESDFQFVKSLEGRNLVVPVVGDLGGTHALPAIAELLRQRGDRISAIYASNAEDYVMRDGGFARYAKSIVAMPRDAHSVFIRSWFGGEGSHPENVPGFFSTQLLQTLDDFAADMAAGGYRAYYELTRKHFVPLR
jgi:hypothetical protein